METLFVGQNLISLSECPSVNTHANMLLKQQKVPEGTVIFTPNQTSGRGQRGTNWYSEPGKNITMSAVLYPVFLNTDEAFLLSMTASMAVYDLLSCFLPLQSDIRIKWPNDLLVSGRKICGILIENVLREGKIVSSVLGVGINVNQTEFFVQHGNATSIKKESDMDLDVMGLMDRFCGFLESRYLALRRGDKAKMIQDYNDALYLRGQEHTFKTGEGEEIKAIIQRVGTDGKLVLKDVVSGQCLQFGFKELIF
jgi:BirA family transcriptional regulator, biotin operon repressor / biotin---[acetyl-CoA-carboxylase] ligase